MAKFGLGLILPIINPQAGIFYNTGIATILKQVFNLVVLILLSIVFLVLHLMVLELVLILSLVLVSLFSLINPKACTSSNGYRWYWYYWHFSLWHFPFQPLIRYFPSIGTVQILLQCTGTVQCGIFSNQSSSSRVPQLD